MEIEWDWEYTAHGNILRLYAKRKRFLKSTRIAVSYDDWESSLEGISPGLALLQMLFLQESDELQVSESRESVEIQNTLFSLFSDIEAQSLGCVPKVPFEFKLLSSGVLYRRHTDSEVIKVMEDWWVEIKRGSKRDQLSFNYSAWKNNFDFEYINNDVRHNQYFDIKKHNK